MYTLSSRRILGTEKRHVIGKELKKELKVAQADVSLQSALMKSTQMKMNTQMVEVKTVQKRLASMIDALLQLTAAKINLVKKTLTFTIAVRDRGYCIRKLGVSCGRMQTTRKTCEG